jgi:branched-chain amino acid transport system substrate-binding protein
MQVSFSPVISFVFSSIFLLINTIKSKEVNMSKQAIFRIDKGDFEQGFPVTLTIKENREICAPEARGSLAPAPEIIELYNIWQQAYSSWGQRHRWWRRQIDVPQQMETNSSNFNIEPEVNKYAREFESAFNKWLDRSSLEKVTRQLLHTVGKNESVSFIVETDNKYLQKLPWELWNFLQDPEYYDHPEIALSGKKFPKTPSWSGSVKILVILGSNKNIDIETDWNIIQNKFQNAELVLLQKPQSSQLKETLRSQPWNIIFFAGHSGTQSEGNDGRIWINDEDYLSPDQLKTSLSKAAKNGLKLAIFNSCDGLGLARQLESLHIPHIIVMREPIHDQVAQMFLDSFLTEFAKGASLHEAVREARDQLRLIENDSPNASWLPVIFQNPEEPPLFYPQEEPSPKPVDKLPDNREPGQKIKKLAFWGGIGAIALATLTFGISKIIDSSKDSTLSPGISLGEEILSKTSTPEKQAGVKAFGDKNYSDAVANFKASLQKNPNDPEARIYLNNAKAANSKQIIKIAASVPFGGNQTIAEEMLRGVAEVQEEINRDDGINGKPLQVVIANDDNNNIFAEKVAHKFVRDPAIFAVVGHNSSNASVAAAPIYKEGKLVMISPTSFGNELKYNAYVFRMVPQITFFAAQSSRAIGKAIHNPKVAVCVDTEVSYDQASFKKEFLYVLSAYGGQHVDIPCNLADPSFNSSTVVEALIKYKPNSLMVAPFVNNLPKGIEIFKAVQKKQLSIQLFGSPTLYTEQTIPLGGEAVEGLTLSVPYYPDATEKNSFRNQWKTQLNSWRSPMAKDATKVIVTGLDQLLKQQQPTREALDTILRNPNFRIKGVTGEFKFNKDTGEREFLFQQGTTDALVRIQDGKFVKLK